MAPLLSLAVGIVLLVVGAEALVRGASRLALAVGLSRLVVGLVVVSLGTSAPEAAVTLGAALQGQADLAVGNVVGSNTFNVLFVLGLSALLLPLAVSRRLVRLDVPVMLGISLLAVALAVDGVVGRVEGVVLLGLAAAYTVLNVRLGRREAAAEAAEAADVEDAAADGGAAGVGDEADGGAAGDGDATASGVRRGLVVAAVLAGVGVVLLVAGSRLAVAGAVDLARGLGVSELVVGLTIVAVGTSLPEVATSVLAAVRGEREIAVGNIVGSNILNIAFILGIASVVAPAGLGVAAGVLTFDLPVMVAAAAVVVPVAFTGHLVARWEGGMLLFFYAAYVAYLALTAVVHPAADELGFALLWFVLPLTGLMVVSSVVRELRRRRRAGPS